MREFLQTNFSAATEEGFYYNFYYKSYEGIASWNDPASNLCTVGAAMALIMWSQVRGAPLYDRLYMTGPAIGNPGAHGRSRSIINKNSRLGIVQ